MNKHLRLLAPLFALFTCAANAQTTKVNSVLDMNEFIQDWKISKQFTLDVANAMPAELYNFKPNSDEMTFANSWYISQEATCSGFIRLQVFSRRLCLFLLSLPRRTSNLPSGCSNNLSIT
jgi:hypothetical protein